MCSNHDGELLLSSNSGMFVLGGAKDEMNKHTFFVAAVNPEAPGHLLRAEEKAVNLVQPGCTLLLVVCRFVSEYGVIESVNADNSLGFAAEEQSAKDEVLEPCMLELAKLEAKWDMYNSTRMSRKESVLV